MNHGNGTCLELCKTLIKHSQKNQQTRTWSKIYSVIFHHCRSARLLTWVIPKYRRISKIDHFAHIPLLHNIFYTLFSQTVVFYIASCCFILCYMFVLCYVCAGRKEQLLPAAMSLNKKSKQIENLLNIRTPPCKGHI